jgi:hypothetical protein
MRGVILEHVLHLQVKDKTNRSDRPSFTDIINRTFSVDTYVVRGNEWVVHSNYVHHRVALSSSHNKSETESDNDENEQTEMHPIEKL